MVGQGAQGEPHLVLRDLTVEPCLCRGKPQGMPTCEPTSPWIIPPFSSTSPEILARCNH